MKRLKKRSQRTLLRTGILIAAVIVGLLILYGVEKLANRKVHDITLEQAQTLVEENLFEIIDPNSACATYIADQTTVTVNSMTKGKDRNITIGCSYETIDVGHTIEANLERYLTTLYGMYKEREEKGLLTGASNFRLRLNGDIMADLETAGKQSGEFTVELYELNSGEYVMYYADETVNTVFGGLVDAYNAISAAESVTYEGETFSIANQGTLREGVRSCLSLRNYSKNKPDTSIPLAKFWNSVKFDFYRNFIEKSRYMFIVRGILMTLGLTICSVLLGVVLGFIVAIIRVTNQKTGRLEIADDICQIYLAIMRGTPVMVQLMIMYFVMLLPLGVTKFPAAVLCFGLNSGAYVSEIVRGGIMAIDDGQFEAGRSIGFSYIKTMYYIIIPQAFKAVLPALANEFIALLKETSVAFYIGVADLTLGGIKIRSVTYSNFMPLIAIAVCYLVIVLGLSKCVSILERRLRKGDRS